MWGHPLHKYKYTSLSEFSILKVYILQRNKTIYIVSQVHRILKFLWQLIDIFHIETLYNQIYPPPNHPHLHAHTILTWTAQFYICVFIETFSYKIIGFLSKKKWNSLFLTTHYWAFSCHVSWRLPKTHSSFCKNVDNKNKCPNHNLKVRKKNQRCNWQFKLNTLTSI